MAAALIQAPVRDEVQAQPWLNRRAAVRHPIGPVTKGRMAEGASFRFRRARIQDISFGGIALLTRQQLPVGTPVWIQLTNEILGITYDLSARVAHATRKARDSWVIGCAFSRALTEPELESLLY
jgi:PilZ domain